MVHNILISNKHTSSTYINKKLKCFYFIKVLLLFYQLLENLTFLTQNLNANFFKILHINIFLQNRILFVYLLFYNEKLLFMV